VTLVAINVLMEPDRATVDHALAINAQLKSNFPQGFALDGQHTPHVTLVQCYVAESDVAGAARSLRSMLADGPPMNWNSRAIGLYALMHENLGLMGIVIEPTEDLRRLQGEVIRGLAPFTVPVGAADAFAPQPDGAPVTKETIEYVNSFIATRTGEHYNPHLTVGLGTRDFVEALKAEPFETLPFSAVSVSLYQLGEYGTAQKKLHDLHSC
jgi:hypothetical protein